MNHYRYAAALAASLTASAHAEMLSFKVALDGSSMPAPTGSKATGEARVRIDTERHLVSVDMDVRGISIGDLWDVLVAKPIGPVHFHKYGSHHHVADDVVLILPLPYGPTYRATASGFRIHSKRANYETGAKLLGPVAPFDDFIAAMQNGKIVLNVHTDLFHDGEIAGTVVSGSERTTRAY